ncbi:Neutral metalloprotease, putative [Candidatus Vecturithrix granuli]|uniref:Neutral metalloprotease, putative n=1 Tax=Vecturithrix granuli TaxID=1499967 RepID=A0A081CAJ6_VECG1|nr:Neutral metalloprotease, putative [Candidatus Vecturithrix granuli]
MFKPDPKSSKYLAAFEPQQEEMRSRSISALKTLHEKASGRVKIRWNLRTGAVHSVRGLLTESQKGTAQDIADRFLSENHELFGISADVSELHFTSVEERRGVKHVKYQQHYRGLEVIGAEMTVHIDQSNRVQMVNGNYFPGIQVDLSTSSVSENTAIEATLQAIQTDEQPAAQTDLVIFPQGDQYVRAYKVTMKTKNPLGDWVFFVEASTGTLLDGYNAIRFVTGTGNLYNSNPERDDKIVTAKLSNLDESGSLSGTYFCVQNAEDGVGNATPTGPGSYDFLYADPANTHFDEVMAYYHLSKVAEFFRNLGHTEHVTPMPAHVHVPDPYTGNAKYDNAYYSAFENAIYFGHGETLNDLAKEAAVIYHEYTHSVIHAIQPFMATQEAGALHEGYADYFACSLTSDPKIGEFVVGQLGKEFLRDLRNEKTYEDYTGNSVHDDGEIWGATCWEIQEALGRHVADLLIYQSLWYLPQNATFADAYDAIVQADTILFDSDHLEELEQIFEEKKIIATTCKIVASASTGGNIVPSGTVSVNQGVDQTFTITPNTGYVIQDVLVDESSVGAVTIYTFTNVAASHTIKAMFALQNQGTYTVAVPGNTQWMDSGITINVGDVISFAAQGTVVYDSKGNSCGPAGASWTDTRDKKDPLWQKPHAGLIGKIQGIGSSFFIGSAYKVKAASSGKLLLGINDYWYQGNSGKFTVTIRVEKV